MIRLNLIIKHHGFLYLHWDLAYITGIIYKETTNILFHFLRIFTKINQNKTPIIPDYSLHTKLNGMKVDIHNEKGIVIIKLKGKYNTTEAHNFNPRLIDQFEPNYNVVAINLREVKYIDSYGIGSLIRLMNISLKKNVDFLCYDLNENIKKIFKLAKIEKVLNILSEEDFTKNYVNISKDE